MLRSNMPRAVRHLRRRRRWRQADLAAVASVSREAVSRLERGLLRGVTIGTAEKVVAALDGSVDVTVRWEGADLDRTIDAAHARLQEHVSRELRRLGWLVRVEVSFNHFGDRGRIDILASHSGTRTLLVVEVKSALGDLQDAIGRLDVKARLGRKVGSELGWPESHHVVPMLAITDSRTTRRIVAAHAMLFERYRLRGRRAVAWLRDPGGPTATPSGLLWFVNVTDSHAVTVTRDRRVRTVLPRP